MSPGGVFRHPCFNGVRGHRTSEEDVVMLDIGMQDSALVRNSDPSKQVKSYPLSERKREATWPRLDERFHVASVYRHHKAHVRAGRAFSGNREFIQELRAVRRKGQVRDETERISLPGDRTLVQIRHVASKRLYGNELVVTVKAWCQFVAVL
jgi:hypothetical protein